MAGQEGGDISYFFGVRLRECEAYVRANQARRHDFAPAQRPVVEKTNEREKQERRPEHVPLRNLGWQETVDLGEALFVGNSNAKFP